MATNDSPTKIMEDPKIVSISRKISFPLKFLNIFNRSNSTNINKSNNYLSPQIIENENSFMSWLGAEIYFCSIKG
jgi:hypothetical protein